MYMYSIRITRTKKRVSTEHQHTLGQDALTIAGLQEIVGEYLFEVEKDEYNQYVVTVYSWRLETDEEQNARIAKEEAYMVKYHKRQQARNK